MDLLRVLESTARQAAQQKDKIEAIKAQEEALRKELASAHESHAVKKKVVEGEQQKQTAMAVELQHTAAAIAEVQAANEALKLTISNIRSERQQLSNVKDLLQEEFVKTSLQLKAQTHGMLAHARSCLASQTDVLELLRNGMSSAPAEIEEATDDAVTAWQAEAAPCEGASADQAMLMLVDAGT